MKRSKRERKISKVMGEFKDGSLKSGGSGRKVTNPKQAIAIALSEAEGMNQGGIVSLAQTGSPFTNSIRPRRQTNMGPRSIAPMQQRGFQSPMQRNFMQLQNQMQSMQQNPLELYQGYLGQKYIGPMQQEQQDKISQFVGAVNQAERQVFGGQQDGKTFGGRLQPGMPGSGLQNQPSILQPTNQAPDVMPPMNQAPNVMPQQLQPLRMNQGGMMYSDIMNRPMFQTPQQRQGLGIMAGVAPVRGYKDGDLADKEDGTEEEGEGLFNETLAKASELGEDAIKYAQENPVEAALMFIPGLGAAGLAVRFGPKIIRGLMRGASKSRVRAKEEPSAMRPKSEQESLMEAIEGAPKPPSPPPSIAAIRNANTAGFFRAAGVPAAAAGAIKRNPGKTILGGLGLAGLSTIGENEPTTDEPSADTSTDETGGGGEGAGDQQSGIMKFLFGSDGIGGEPGAVGKAVDYLADPKTRYALARAAESRPGVVDRNFFTDFTLGQAEYEAAQQQNQTAFMKNFEALREIYPDDVSDEEVAKLALGDSDDPRKTFLSLFEAKVGSMIPPTEADIKNFAALSGFELSDAQIKQLVSSVKPSDTVS